MAPRAYWKGVLRLSLISCPVALHTTASERARIGFHQFNRATGNRVRRPNTDEITGEHVEPEDIVRGYQEADEPFVEITDEDLEAISPGGGHEISVDGFVPRGEIDLAHIARSYHVVPDGPHASEVYALIRETLAATRTAAMARIAMTGRELVAALLPRGDGILALVMHYAYEMHEEVVPHPFETRIPREMRSLAKNLVARRMKRFDPTRFRDGYEEALKELIARKRKGVRTAPQAPKRVRAAPDLMEALKRSVRKQGPRRTTKKPAPTAGGRRNAAAGKRTGRRR